MTKMKKIAFLLMLLIIVLLGAPSCAPEVSQQEYDSLQNELSETKSQLTALQNKLAEAKRIEAQYEELSVKYEELKEQSGVKISEIETIEAQYEELNAKYEELKGQSGVKISEIETIEAQYEELNAKYEELKEQYDAIIEGTAGISEEDVEQALFELINQERKNNGLDELLWGKNLSWWAEVNSRDMAETKKYKHSEYASWQEVFWAAGYSTIDRIANGALITWRSNTYRYKLNILNTGAIYGAVGAYKSGEIFYITYIAHVFR